MNSGYFSTQKLTLFPVLFAPPVYKKGADGHFYFFHQEKKNYNEALKICQEEGANLAIIYDVKTRNAVTKMASSLKIKKSYWIGVTNQWTGKWQTPLRDTVTYTSWFWTEPTYYCTSQNKRNTWFATRCYKTKPFVCQIHAGEP